jgi:hypothetical protein
MKAVLSVSPTRDGIRFMESPPQTVDLSTLPIQGLEKPGTLDEATAPAAPATPPADGADVLCPRCGAKLISPESLGWCPKCRYCRTIEQDAPKVARATNATKASALGATEFMNLVAKLPQWVWVMAAGSAAIALISFASQIVLPPECLPRAIWSTAQLGLGLITLIAAQIWALLVLAPEDDRLGAKDIFFAVRLWSLTTKRLPEMARQVWIGVWGASAMVCAVLLVGGMSYWTRFYKPERVADKNLIAAVVAMAQGKNTGKDLIDSVEDFAASQDLTKKKEDEDDSKPDKRPTIHCLILGYNLGRDKELSELVLGTLQDDRIRYAGRVKRGFNPEINKELIARLAPLEVPTPLLPDLQFTAVWVKPELFCEVHQSGFDDQGYLKNPKYHGLLKVEQ